MWQSCGLRIGSHPLFLVPESVSRSAVFEQAWFINTGELDRSTPDVDE